MNTSFGFIRNNIIEINDWHQLLNLESSIKDVAVSVNTIDDDVCHGESITIYNKITNFVYVCFFVLGDNSKQADVTNLTLSTEQASTIINTFGYNIAFVPEINLTIETKQLLESLYSIGYKYIYKTISGKIIIDKFENPYYNLEEYFTENHLDVKMLPNYDLYDFSFVEDNINYSIYNLLNQ